jgi:UDP-N-acetylmuramoylalanine--D-glutamate ligase
MKKVLVVGLGLSGLSVVDYLLKKGIEVVGVDKSHKEIEGCQVFSDEFEFREFDFDLVVVSPGISQDHLIYQRALLEGVKIMGEAELALSQMKKHKIIGVTGSNGKSTTVMLITHVLNMCGKKARALGNIGKPLISAVDELDEDEIVVAELSSFQLETMTEKLFDVAVILNLTPNHLDRHKTMENYFLAKRKIAESLKENGLFYIGESILENYEHMLAGFSYNVICDQLMEFVKNICLHFGLSEEEVIEAAKTFKSLPHRLEFVCEIGGVRCYNDSKATTMDAVSYAVKKLEKDVILIAGGRHKGGSFSIWNESFPGRVKAIILLGEAKELIASELSLKIPIYFVESLEKAIEKGLQVAKPRDNLILSPGCSSYDMFLNFEKRGEAYKKGLERESKRYDCHFSSC